MNNLINIAKNENTIFFSIDIKSISNEIIELVNQILKEESQNNDILQFVDDEEQRELESIIKAQSENDKKIVKTEKLIF